MRSVHVLDRKESGLENNYNVHSCVLSSSSAKEAGCLYSRKELLTSYVYLSVHLDIINISLKHETPCSKPHKGTSVFPKNMPAVWGAVIFFFLLELLARRKFTSSKISAMVLDWNLNAYIAVRLLNPWGYVGHVCHWIWIVKVLVCTVIW